MCVRCGAVCSAAEREGADGGPYTIQHVQAHSSAGCAPVQRSYSVLNSVQAAPPPLEGTKLVDRGGTRQDLSRGYREAAFIRLHDRGVESWVVCLAPLGVIELTVRYTEWAAAVLRGAVGSGAAAVESAAVSKLVTHLSCLVRTRGSTCVLCRRLLDGWL